MRNRILLIGGILFLLISCIQNNYPHSAIRDAKTRVILEKANYKYLEKSWKFDQPLLQYHSIINEIFCENLKASEISNDIPVIFNVGLNIEAYDHIELFLKPSNDKYRPSVSKKSLIWQRKIDFHPYCDDYRFARRQDVVGKLRKEDIDSYSFNVYSMKFNKRMDTVGVFAGNSSFSIDNWFVKNNGKWEVFHVLHLEY